MQKSKQSNFILVIKILILFTSVYYILLGIFYKSELKIKIGCIFYLLNLSINAFSLFSEIKILKIANYLKRELFTKS
jgi:hypothetical protein